MKYEIGGFVVWMGVYLGMNLAVERWSTSEHWFFWGCITGILCAAIGTVVRKLKQTKDV